MLERLRTWWKRRKLPPSLQVVPNKTLTEQTDSELRKERAYWDRKVTSATHWGASLAAASEFRDACDRELLRRKKTRI